MVMFRLQIKGFSMQPYWTFQFRKTGQLSCDHASPTESEYWSGIEVYRRFEL